MDQTKKKHNEQEDDKNRKCDGDGNMVHDTRAARYFRKICLIILAVIVTLGILTFSFWLNYQVITGEAQSNILFWKMAN